MKVLITDVSGFVQEAIAKGLVAVLADAPSIEVLIEREGFAIEPKRVPVKRAAAKKAAAKKAAKPAKTVAAEGDAPRVAIRSRVLACLKEGPKTGRQVEAALMLGPHVDILTHLSLIKRDKLAARNEEGLWTLL